MAARAAHLGRRRVYAKCLSHMLGSIGTLNFASPSPPPPSPQKPHADLATRQPSPGHHGQSPWRPYRFPCGLTRLVSRTCATLRTLLTEYTERVHACTAVHAPLSMHDQHFFPHFPRFPVIPPSHSPSVLIPGDPPAPHRYQCRFPHHSVPATTGSSSAHPCGTLVPAGESGWGRFLFPQPHHTRSTALPYGGVTCPSAPSLRCTPCP